VHIAQEQYYPTDAEANFINAFQPSVSRYNIHLTPAQLSEVKAAYLNVLMQITDANDRWNHDFEQFVVAYKPEYHPSAQCLRLKPIPLTAF
jgi:hypothetical protein